MIRSQSLGAAITVVATLAVLAVPTATSAQVDPSPSDLAATDLHVGGVTEAAIPRTGGVGVVGAVVTNGPTGAAATHVTVRYVLPAGATHEPTAPGATPGCTGTVGTVVCDLGTLPPGGSAKLGVGVRVGATEPGTLIGSFLPPISDRFDPAAGEIAARTWYHEADGQGVTVQTCWPVEAASIRLIDCDGTPSPRLLVPNESAVLDAFPPAFSAPVVRSWEWRTRIRPGLTGADRVRAGGIDDGGYVAIAPAGETLSAGNVVLDVPSFTAASEGAVQLEAGREYDVLIRIVNRGNPGADNGGSSPGGWGYVGVLPAVSPCSPDAALAFGTAGASLGSAVPGPIRVAASASIRVSGTVTDGLGEWSQAQVINDGPDAATVTATVAGQTSPIPPIQLAPGTSTVVQSALEPGTVGVLGQDPWDIASNDSLPPQP